MTDREIQASDEEMEQFNVLQNEKCVSAKEEKLNDLMNKISFALKDATLAQGFEIICKRISELEKENERLQKVILEQNILNIDFALLIIFLLVKILLSFFIFPEKTSLPSFSLIAKIILSIKALIIIIIL